FPSHQTTRQREKKGGPSPPHKGSVTAGNRSRVVPTVREAILSFAVLVRTMEDGQEVVAAEAYARSPMDVDLVPSAKSGVATGSRAPQSGDFGPAPVTPLAFLGGENGGSIYADSGDGSCFGIGSGGGGGRGANSSGGYADAHQAFSVNGPAHAQNGQLAPRRQKTSEGSGRRRQTVQSKGQALMPGKLAGALTGAAGAGSFDGSGGGGGDDSGGNCSDSGISGVDGRCGSSSSGAPTAAKAAAQRFAEFVSDVVQDCDDAAAQSMWRRRHRAGDLAIDGGKGEGGDGDDGNDDEEEAAASAAEAAAAAGDAAGATMAGGGLSPEQVTRAYREVAALRAAGALGEVEAETLRQLLRLLARCVRAASATDAFQILFSARRHGHGAGPLRRTSSSTSTGSHGLGGGRANWNRSGSGDGMADDEDGGFGGGGGGGGGGVASPGGASSREASASALAALAAVETGLEAAAAALAVMASPGLDRPLVEDEAVEDCVTLLKQHVTRHVAPAFNPAALAAIRSSGSGGGGAAASEDEEGVDYNQAGADGGDGKGGKIGKGGKKGKSGGKVNAKCGGAGKGGGGGGGGAEDVSALLPVCKRVLRGLGRVYEVVEQFSALVAAIALQDAFLLQLCQAATAALTAEGGSGDVAKLRPLHHHALGLLQAVFGRHQEHRASMLEDLFGLWARLPPPGSTRRDTLHAVRLSAVLSEDAPDAGGGAVRTAVGQAATGHAAMGHSAAVGHAAHGRGGGGGGHAASVHTVSALAMLFVQSCVRRPPLAGAAHH
ncbi:unnamed protein product, partial [Phaeothamnion confervicola]